MNIEIMVGVIVALGVLFGIFHKLRGTFPWIENNWKYIAGTILSICLIVIILLFVQVFSSQPETRERPVALYKLNDHCADPQNVRWTIKASEGWEIDVASIEIEATSVSSKSSYTGVQNATKTGFDIVGRVVNSGRCVREPLTRTLIIKDGRGSLRIYGKYTEIQRTRN